ncbi:MAG: hypothetical protein AAFV53_33935 [Myxococcota bacterium]
MRWTLGGIAIALMGCSKEHEETLGEDRAESAAVQDPALQVQSPAPASWLPVGDVEVTGIAQRVTDVQLNDSALPVDDARFNQMTALDRGINLLAVTALTPDGVTLRDHRGVLAGDFAEPDQPVVDGVIARINQSGLNDVTDFIAGFVTPELIGEQIGADTPIAAGDILSIFSYEASLTGVTFGEPDIIVQPLQDVLQVQASLPMLDVQMSVYIDVYFTDFTVDASLTADRAVISTTMRPGVGEDTLTMDLEDTAIELLGFFLEISAVPDWLEGIDLLQSEIQSAVEDELINQFNTLVPEILDETLDALDFSFETELLGKTLSVQAGFAAVAVDPSGLEIGVDVSVIVPGTGDKTYAGYLAAEQPAPALGRDADMSVMLADDFLNRVLFEIWRGGMIDLTLSTEDGSLDPELLSDFPVDVAAINVDARLPPVVVDAGDKLMLQLAEWTVTLDSPGSSIGNKLVADIAGEAELFVFVDEGALGVELGELSVDLMVLESDWSLSEENLDTLIDTFLTPSTLMGLLEGLTFDLPELYGVRLTDAVVARADSDLHTAVGINLEVLSE